jgi:Domain of unknown function (DUF4282)
MRHATRGRAREEGRMFDVRDLFQWERFITPSIIRVFFWLAFFVALVAGVYGVLSGLQLLPFNPLAAFLVAIGSITGTCLAILSARLVAEFLLITFRVNDHLGALRSRAEM